MPKTIRNRRAEQVQFTGRIRKNTVGFALTLLQRRLASSPAAIFQSLDGRRARLQERLDALRSEATSWNGHPVVDAERMEDAPEFERSAKEDEVLSSATAAQTAAELRAEIVSLERLTAKANAVLRSGTDTKWQQLSQLLNEQVFQHTAGPPRKLVVFTEHVATLQYLVSRIQRLFGSRKVLVKIYGSMRREARLTAQEEFHNNPDVRVLVATDAAGEGINLQCAHLMINYDLPWNPNRLEQRFGRIHRIGQTSVCQLWNLVAKDTREGSVYEALLHKLDNVSRALGGKVFDVLGTLDFGGRALRDLLIEAIRYGDRPEVQNYLKTAVEDALDAENVLRKYQEIALLEIEMDSATIRAKREEMQRARMRRLQPHYVEAFFKEAFTRIGGHMYRREARRYEVSYVPPHARGYRGRAARVASKYRRITFEHARSYLPGKVAVESISPGHPLLESVTADILHRDGDTLAKGTVLVDEADSGEQPHILFHLEHELRTAEAKSRVVSKRMLYVLAGADGSHRQLNTTPYLDWRPLKPEEPAPRHILANPLCRWISRDIEKAVEAYVTQHVVPEHMEAVQQRRDKRLDKEQRMVKKRLTHEITRWNRRSQELRLAEQEGKPAARMNSAEARRRAAEFRARLDARLDRLAAGKPVTALRPVITGAILVVPQGLLNAVAGKPGAPERAAAPDTRAFEARAREIILEIERGFGYQAKDVAHRTLGYDIESRDTDSGHLRFIRVKACAKGAENVSLTRNEVLFSLNNPEGYILGLVEFLAAGDHDVHYVWQPTNRAPDFGVSRRTYSMNFLLSKAQPPRKG